MVKQSGSFFILAWFFTMSFKKKFVDFCMVSAPEGNKYLSQTILPPGFEKISNTNVGFMLRLCLNAQALLDKDIKPNTDTPLNRENLGVLFSVAMLVASDKLGFNKGAFESAEIDTKDWSKALDALKGFTIFHARLSDLFGRRAAALEDKYDKLDQIFNKVLDPKEYEEARVFLQREVSEAHLQDDEVSKQRLKKSTGYSVSEINLSNNLLQETFHAMGRKMKKESSWEAIITSQDCMHRHQEFQEKIALGAKVLHGKMSTLVHGLYLEQRPLAQVIPFRPREKATTAAPSTNDSCR